MPVYLIANGEKPFEGWVALESSGKAAVLYNPMAGTTGLARSRPADGRLELWLQLQPTETLIVEVRAEDAKGNGFPYIGTIGTPLEVEGSWQVEFTEGGPEIPRSETMSSLKSWTDLSNDQVKSFSGMATYSLTFPKPRQNAAAWVLDLGAVKESAEVILNGKSLGILIGPIYKVGVDNTLLKKQNLLQVRIANLMANRISYMDKQKVFWKKFYNVNFPARKAENRVNGIFDAAAWKPKLSGLLGPVTLAPIEAKSFDNKE